MTKRMRTVVLGALTCVFCTLLSLVSCVTSESASSGDSGKPAFNRDYLIVEINFPGHLRVYMQQVRDELAMQDRYVSVSEVHSHGGGMWGMDVKLDIEKHYRQYPFITYQEEDTLRTISARIDASAITTLLMVPSIFLPPATLNLSEAEIIEFYSWRLADAIPANQIGRLLRSIEITAVLQTRASLGFNSRYWDSVTLSQLINGSKVLQVTAKYYR